VVRGGAFNFSDYGVRAALRYWYYPHRRKYNVGFRVVFSPFTTDH
jgi:formylglycine-generating enzyme required for sulfatase activity